MLQTKILVLRKNRLLIGIGILLLAALLVFLLTREKLPESDRFTSSLPDELYQTEATYKAGVYTSAIALNDSMLHLEIVLDSNHINSVRLVNLEESITTMYPLMEPALASLAEQLVNGVELEKISYSEDKKFTQMLLMEVIEKTLEKAAIE